MSHSDSFRSPYPTIDYSKLHDHLHPMPADFRMAEVNTEPDVAPQAWLDYMADVEGYDL
ncbi:MAG: hypothetical protein RLY93_04490 [Sumerlaeia bacterium]